MKLFLLLSSILQIRLLTRVKNIVEIPQLSFKYIFFLSNQQVETEQLKGIETYDITST